MNNQPNIVLIVVDQWRGDCLSGAGHPVVETPYLDKMMVNGVHLQNAYSTTPTCIPARATLYTGQKACHHGRVGYMDGVNWNYKTTLAGEFTRHGYQTQAIGKMHVYPERSQLGFQNVILHDGYLHHARNEYGNHGRIDDYLPWLEEQLGRKVDYLDHGVDCNSNLARPWDKPEYTHPTNFVMSQSIDFLRRRDPRKPFFLYISFHRPHPPYDPPQAYFDQYINRDMPEPPVGDWHKKFAHIGDVRDPNTLYGELSHNRLQRARAGYYGHMSHIDHQLQRFFEVMREYGEFDNTWFLFTSDHGEMMGDHHLFRKAFPYEGSAHIPMIIQPPPGANLPKNKVVDQPVCLRDVMPTLLDCAGLPIPNSVDGKSILPLITDEKEEWRTYLQGEHIYAGQSMMYVTNGHEKYVWLSTEGDEQYFDLDTDPQELNDLSENPAYSAKLAVLRRELIKALEGREEGFTDGKQLFAGRPVHPVLSFLRKETHIS